MSCCLPLWWPGHGHIGQGQRLASVASLQPASVLQIMARLSSGPILWPDLQCSCPGCPDPWRQCVASAAFNQTLAILLACEPAWQGPCLPKNCRIFNVHFAKHACEFPRECSMRMLDGLSLLSFRERSDGRQLPHRGVCQRMLDGLRERLMDIMLAPSLCGHQLLGLPGKGGLAK